MNRTIILVLGLLVSGLVYAQQVPVTGVEGASLKSIVNTPTLVTVLLKEGGSVANLRITNLYSEHLSAISQDNEEYPYLYCDIREVQVQGGEIEAAKFQLPDGQLGGEAQKIVDRAWVRATEVYTKANENQKLKVSAAALLALNGDKEPADYLKKLAESNDTQTQIDASLALYLVGEEVSEKLIRMGLEHGNRNIRADAAVLSGLVGYEHATPVLNKMLRDRASELAAPAARAMARMGNREIIPTLFEMLASRGDLRNEAAMYSLVKLGGEDIIEQLNIRRKKANGEELFRIVMTLHSLGDPNGRKLLEELFDSMPTKASEVARVLAREGDWKGGQFLRERIQMRQNLNESNLTNKANNAAALYAGGDASAAETLRQLLRDGEPPIKQKVLELVAREGDSGLLKIVQASIETADMGEALGACTVAVCVARPEFAARLFDVSHDKPAPGIY